MKIVMSADWRDDIPFETPMMASESAPGEPIRCASCDNDKDAFPRDELWAFKHRHPTNHAGFVRFYCAEHVPAAVVEQPAAPVAAKATKTPRASRAATPARRPTPAEERPRAVCPTCYIEVSAKGVCGMCGEQVA
ncbi:hypothetical protein FHX49_000712 [Microbacterium endophyticum]|uniref:Glucose-6-phosphate dehydrogenase n=1 Tax=Microbacterium endophyticum TaxID=1526412 RepID=A0A7W4V1L9_9MICO|nr:glucose-6-phosphate dehydrogenase [Microbacterium endophyticum]MBB2975171.1 hypothetical protein [Microbacterium endophyticum]NIK37617.1 hypothetical protein [Microbacterium endophyticum]